MSARISALSGQKQQAAITTSSHLSYWLTKLAQVLPIVLFAAALTLVYHQLEHHRLADILAAAAHTPNLQIAASIGLMAINYLVLAGYDWLALRFTGHGSVPLTKMLAAALLSYAISNNTGHAWAAGGSVRYRFYSKWGVPGWDILKISLFQSVTYWIGAVSLGTVASMLLPHYLAGKHPIPNELKLVGWLCAAALLGYWGLICAWRKPITVRGYAISLPSPAMTGWQTLISAFDVLLSAMVLWALLAGRSEVSFEAFLSFFVVAQVAGVLSQVPGGLGVFEATLLWLMSAVGGSSQHMVLVGALLLYRLVYYFLPLIIAGCGLLSYEAYLRRQAIAYGRQLAERWLATIVPHICALLLVWAGGVLLMSGALPAAHHALAELQSWLPLPVLELSHLTGSVLGLVLLFLARGIELRIRLAWYFSFAVLGLGIAVSLLKGLEWRQALILGMVWLSLLPARSYFQRNASLSRMPFSGYGLSCAAMLVLASVWFGFFSHRHVAYSHELWWQFSYDGSAPRFLRATLTLGVLTLGYGLWRLFSVAPPIAYPTPGTAELDEVSALLKTESQTQGYLALLGDKALFWNPQRSSMLMFAVTRRFWIAMGDPIGDATGFEELLYCFQEEADRYGAKVVFYQVSPQWLPIYLDLGLRLFKLGEEARVNLSDFNLQGKRREAQRSARNKFCRLGYGFEIIAGSALAEALPQLKGISDAWLTHKRTREKGFSLGFFQAEYLQRTAVAVVKDPAGAIVAFANLWQTGNHEELSIDLMRYAPGCPGGIMDYLFAELLLWGKQQGYRWFSLGMAPLAGMERRRLAPLWHKIGATLFTMGDQFYNFEGLYQYKAKFASDWQPRYLAVPSGLSAPYVMAAITRLIAGGWQGIFGK